MGHLGHACVDINICFVRSFLISESSLQSHVTPPGVCSHLQDLLQLLGRLDGHGGRDDGMELLWVREKTTLRLDVALNSLSHSDDPN